MAERTFLLMVDSGSQAEPPNRRYGSLDAALAAYAKLEPQYQRYAWIIERGEAGMVTRMRDGRLV